MSDSRPKLGRERCSLRLSKPAHERLLANARRYGDISALVLEALLGTNLETVPVVVRPKFRGTSKGEYLPQQVHLDPAVVKMAREVAAKRGPGISFNVLVDGALLSYLPPIQVPPKD